MFNLINIHTYILRLNLVVTRGNSPALPLSATASTYFIYCERSELLICQVHQFELRCIKKCAH